MVLLGQCLSNMRFAGQPISNNRIDINLQYLEAKRGIAVHPLHPTLAPRVMVNCHLQVCRVCGSRKPLKASQQVGHTDRFETQGDAGVTSVGGPGGDGDWPQGLLKPVRRLAAVLAVFF